MVKKGRIGPGKIFCVDTTRGAVMDDEEITQKFAARRPYDKWLQENLVTLDEIRRALPPSRMPSKTSTPTPMVMRTPMERNWRRLAMPRL